MNRCGPRLAFATCVDYPTLLPEDAGLLPALRARGLDAHHVPWDDPAIDWTGFEAIVVGGVWGYYKRYPEFLRWLERIERTAVPIWNPPELVRWNSDKRYLRDLAERGIRIIPTAFVDAGASARLSDILRANDWTDAVVKPSVSACGYRTIRVGPPDADRHQQHLDTILESSGALVQRFMPEINIEGEWSASFYAGTLSHAVLKRPAATDYRVQHRYGGSCAPRQPPAWLLPQLRAVLDALPHQAAYARVDGICHGRDFYLMEAELIDPSWFFDAHPAAIDRYADLLASLVTATVDRLQRR
ncbi:MULTISPECIES: RimK family alpha-L-glutamate ligase [unclassified Nocardia]|uniref:ATP-grasp domain-containing protein n=1 Tax=unclassified Nocardia TaxID=2637762 RepID=UPI001CE44E4D|nr:MULTISPECIES: hypothetical protein [unclassified Nocardia]